MAKNIVLCDEPTCFVKPPFYGGKKTEHHCTTSNPLFTPKKADSFRELSKDNSKLKYRPKTPLASNPRLFTLHHDPFRVLNTTTSTKYMYKPMITARHEIPNVEKQIFEYTHVASLLLNLWMRTGEQRCQWESPHDLVNQREKKNPRNQTANDGVKNIWYSRLATQNST